MSKHTKEELQYLQGLPLKMKIALTKDRIRDWVNEYGLDGVYLSFSGGKDSTVLLHIARQTYPDMKAVFSNTSLEFPEIVKFVKTFSNVDFVKPKMPYVEVIKKYGYPMISKEVSECVFGARKYLTAVIAENSIAQPASQPASQTDRQTDAPYGHFYKKLCGFGEYEKSNRGGTRTNIEGSEELETTHQSMLEIGQETKNVGDTSTNLYTANKCRLEMLKSTESTVLAESVFLRRMLQNDPKQVIDNLRVQRLMGINRTDGKATMENIPSKADRSAFSCERYQFFLDAPFEVGNQCCSVMKKNPMKKYAKETGRKPITAQMASESRLRAQKWLNSGCNGFDLKSPISNPMSFWTENDCLLYVRTFWDDMITWRREEFREKNGCYPEESEFPFTIDSPIASVYGDIVSDNEETGQMTIEDFLDCELFDLKRTDLHATGCNRTGCIACGFGQHHENTKEKSRLQQIIDLSNPKMVDWILRGGHFRESDGMWEPYHGLGMAFVYEWINQHGGFNIWFPNKEYYLGQLPDECWNYIERI